MAAAAGLAGGAGEQQARESTSERFLYHHTEKPPEMYLSYFKDDEMHTMLDPLYLTFHAKFIFLTFGSEETLTDPYVFLCADCFVF